MRHTSQRSQRQLRRQRRRVDMLADGPSLPITWAIAGVQKAATSTLYRLVSAHRLVTRGPEKEMHFFDREDHDWSDPAYDTYRRPAMRPQHRSAGDATPIYFFWPRAMERMQRYRPDMRLIVVVRDPIERAMSQWAMERARKRYPSVPETIEQFASARLPLEVPADRPQAQFRREQQYTRGLYGQQLRRGLSLFPREQWLLLDFQDVARAPHRVLDRVTDHLDLPRFESHPEPRHGHRSSTEQSGPPPTADHVRQLVDSYARDLEEFTHLSGMDVSHWPTWQVAHGHLPAAEFAERIARKLGLS
ncbi:sulfotransferase [Nocardioides panacisoli]|uniref:sulfotransferase domain-containing protein n=1 Tax=Nocardioides panacisoli TaxID=627624 RepID=UPI001C62A856|nr:sulfotransferase domain-containing protein [Nocardioides panacisoli]QYJ03738.1 sulfotransferase [Nocardioides panacisoli]